MFQLLLQVVAMIAVSIGFFVFYMFLKQRANLRTYGHIPHKTAIFSWIPLYMQLLARLGVVKPRINSSTVAEEVLSLMNESKSDVVALIFGDIVLIEARTPKILKYVGVEKRKWYPKAVHIYHVLTHLGSNIVASEGAEWRHHRVVANAAFGQRNNELVAVHTSQIAREMMTVWDQELKAHGQSTAEGNGGCVIDVQEGFFKLALAVIASAGFGQYTDPYNLKGKQMPGAGRTLTFRDALDGVMNNMLFRLVLPTWAYKLPIQKLRYVGACFSDFEAYINDVIDRRSVVGDETMVDEEEPGDLVSLLVAGMSKAQDPLTRQELVSDCFVFLLAGHETTAVTLSWATALLALHPEIQEKVHEEAVAVLGTASGATLDEYDRLKYTQCVMQEVLRLIPPVAAVPKVTTQDVELDGYFIPKDSLVSLQLYGTHLDDRLHKDPRTFRPERFMDETMDKYAWSPFAVGVRSCIGRKFAEVEVAIVLAMACRKYRFSVPEGVTREALLESETKITRRPKNSMKLVVTPRA